MPSHEKKPWYVFTWTEVVWCSSALVIFFVLAGWPHGLLDWMTIPAGLLVGNAAFHWTHRR